MAVLVDPPSRDSADKRPSAETSAVSLHLRKPASPAVESVEPELLEPEIVAPELLEQKLAEPPLTGGRVEALMGRLIRVLSHSPLARPLPAVLLSALGLGGVAFVGLCATAPTPSAESPPVLLPLTSVARNLRAPHLDLLVANTVMYVSISLCCLGLAMMLWANSRGWSPRPRRVFLAAAATIAVLVNITPVGSGDIASYAAYGRIAALGKNPYVFTPNRLPGDASNPYTMLVSPQWQKTASVYGPIATWMQQLAAEIGGPKPWLTIWVLMIMTALAFLAVGYLLLRTAENPVRAVLLWVANPLLIVELVMGGHLDAFLALAAIAAILVARRSRRAWQDAVVGLLIGAAFGIKIDAAFVALAIAIPLLHDRAWARLARTTAVALVSTFCLFFFSYGTTVLKPLRDASTLVISPTLWRLAQVTVQHFFGRPAEHTVTSVFGFVWPVLLLLLAWYLYHRLSPDVPTVVAATCALTFAWIVVAPWSLPWYSSIAWVAVALLPRNSLTRWLTIATGTLAMMHFNGGHTPGVPIGPLP